MDAEARPLPVNHLVVLKVPEDFSAVVVAAAAREGRNFDEQLLQFSILGAECARLHHKKDAHARRGKKA